MNCRAYLSVYYKIIVVAAVSAIDSISAWGAAYIAKRINEHNKKEKRPFVLGLPTGSTPLGTYKKLIEYCKAGKVSFANVVTFNMDEYVGIPKDHPESYHSFMWNNFFKHIDIEPENVNILDGNAEDLAKECADYEARIVEAAAQTGYRSALKRFVT